MKCMFVIDCNLSGGAERVVSILANYFYSNNNEVIVLNFDRDSSFYPLNKGIEVIKLAKKHPQIYSVSNKVLKRIRIIKGTKEEIKMHSPDIVIPFLFDAELAVIPYCVRHSIPCITSVRNDAEMYPKYQRIFRKYFYPKISGIVFQSNAVRNHKDYRKLKNAYVIPNPLDMKLVMKRDIPVDRSKLISVGRLTKQKNHALTIQVMKRLIPDYPALQLHIFGDGPLKNELNNQIEESGLQNNVFLDGIIENAQFNNRDAAAFIMSSNYEGFPNALLEAMACHIPSISTNFKSGTASEALLDGTAGWLVSVGDSIGLEKAIRECLTNYSIAEKKAKVAIEQCKKYSISVIGAKWNDLFLKSLVKRKAI